MPQAPVAKSAPMELERSAAPDTATAATTPRQSAAERGAATGAPSAAGAADLDYTALPTALDRSFEALDDDAALHSTILSAGDTWTRTAQRGLLSDPETESLEEDEQLEEKQKAFDLLDALTKSGALAIEDAALHVVLAATHAFDKTLLETVIQDNVNPIEKVERSLLIVGGTIFGLPPGDLIADDQRERVLAASPRLLGPSPSRHGSDG